VLSPSCILPSALPPKLSPHLSCDKFDIFAQNHPSMFRYARNHIRK